jgi:hypothetical protein
MRLSAYLALLFSISLLLYLIGYQSLASDAAKLIFPTNWNCGDGTTDYSNFTINVTSTTQPKTFEPKLDIYQCAYNVLSNPGTLAGLAITFAAMFFIPLLLIVPVLVILFVPYNYIFDTNIPWELRLFIAGVLNFLMIIAIIDFIRGGI